MRLAAPTNPRIAEPKSQAAGSKGMGSRPDPVVCLRTAHFFTRVARGDTMTGNISTRGAPVSDAAKLLIDQALELSALERAVVAEQLLLSLDRPDPKIDAVWASEAESRLAAYQNGRTEAVPRDGVRS